MSIRPRAFREWNRIQAPGIAGVVNDTPPWRLGPQQLVDAQDMFIKDGYAQQRYGWAFDGTVADVVQGLERITSGAYVLNGNTRTTTADLTGKLWDHKAAGAGTQLYTTGFGSTLPIPRGRYRDMQLWCWQDGVTAMLLYSGSIIDEVTGAFVGSGAPTLTAGQNTLTVAASTILGSPDRGSFVDLLPLNTLGDHGPLITPRLVQVVGTTIVGLEGIKASAGGAIAGGTPFIKAIGQPYPCVNIYEEGAIAGSAGTTFTLTGGDWTGVGFASILYRPGNATAFNYRVTASTATTATVKTTLVTAGNRYAAMARCPFKDAQAHKGSLFGAGVKQHPGKVYVSPPDWNPVFPPGLATAQFATPTYDPGVGYSGIEDVFMLDEIPVPAQYDGDPIVALLPTPGPLLVLKQRSVYGIYGTYPNFEVRLLSDIAGQGCIDIRSAVSRPEGVFWAGPDGIFTFDGTRVVNLLQDVARERWRNATVLNPAALIDVAPSGHLMASVSSSASNTGAFFHYDLRRGVFLGVLSGPSPRCFARTQNQLLAVDNSQTGRVLDLAPMYRGVKSDGSTVAPAADEGASLFPNFSMTLPSNICGDPDVEHVLTRAAITTNLRESGPSVPTFVSSATSGFTSNGATTTIPTPASMATNDIAVMFFHTNDTATTIATPTGWTKLIEQTGGNSRLIAYWQRVAATGYVAGTMTAVTGVKNAFVSVVAIRGCSTDTRFSPVDLVAGKATLASAAPTWGSTAFFTPSHANEFYLAAVAQNGGAGTGPQLSGEFWQKSGGFLANPMTERVDNSAAVNGGTVVGVFDCATATLAETDKAGAGGVASTVTGDASCVCLSLIPALSSPQTLTVSTKASGRVDGMSETTTTIGTITADHIDQQDRTPFRPGVRGRRISLVLTGGNATTTQKRFQVQEVAVEARAMRQGR